MEENNEVLELEAEVTTEELNAFDDDWDDEGSGDDFDLSDDAHEVEEPAEQPEAEPESSEGEPAEQGEEAEEGNQLFEINYLGKKEQLTLEQMTELAQKGRDYDHVRTERDSLKSESGRQLAFLKELADRSGLTVDEQIDRTRALWLQNEEFDKGNEISESEALLRVQRDKTPKQEEAAVNEGDSGTGDFNAQIDRFLKVYPDVKGDDIPQEVWEQTAKMNGDLLGAYQAWKIKELEAEHAKHEQAETNRKNEKRSTGALESAGTSRKHDAFDEGWDSI